MKKIQTSLLTLFICLASQAQAETCPNLEGSWTGTCTLTSEKPSDDIQAGLVASGYYEGPSSLNIKQGFLGKNICSFIDINNVQHTIGSLETTVHSPSEKALPTLSGAQIYTWNNDSLKNTSAGIVKVDEIVMSYTGSERFYKSDDQSLSRDIEVNTNGTVVSLSCTYSKN